VSSRVAKYIKLLVGRNTEYEEKNEQLAVELYLSGVECRQLRAQLALHQHTEEPLEQSNASLDHVNMGISALRPQAIRSSSQSIGKVNVS